MFVLLNYPTIDLMIINYPPNMALMINVASVEAIREMWVLMNARC